MTSAIALYQVRASRPEVSRDQDVFFSSVGLLCGGILVFQGWRLDPLMLFGQLLTVGTAVAAVQYHITNFGKHFQPYLGSGINYTIVLKNHEIDAVNAERTAKWQELVRTKNDAAAASASSSGEVHAPSVYSHT